MTLIKNKTAFGLFYKDSDIKYKVEIALALDPNTGSVIVPRMFHNKVSFALDTFSTSIFSAIDPVYLFSISKNAPLYANDDVKPKMLFQLELVLFVLASIQLIRRYNPKEKIYLFLIILFIFSILILGILTPSFYPPKLLPLVIFIRTTIFFGIFSYLGELKWLRKYFS